MNAIHLPARLANDVDRFRNESLTRPTKRDAAQRILSFRGYNQTNLGRTPELLKHERYGEVVADYLNRASRICAEATGRPTDLVARVRRSEETNLESYAEAVALIVSVEMAQLRLLKDLFDIDHKFAMVSFGFSLGEIAAVVAGASWNGQCAANSAYAGRTNVPRWLRAFL